MTQNFELFYLQLKQPIFWPKDLLVYFKHFWGGHYKHFLDGHLN